MAIGKAGIPALHAAALEPALFHSVTLRRMLISWANIVHHRISKPLLVADFLHSEHQYYYSLMGDIIQGSLQYYDLPNLESSLDKKLTIEQPINAEGADIPGAK